MRIFVFAVLSLCSVSLANAQLQLAPNPACSGGAPYCRSLVAPDPSGSVPVVMGFNNGFLYSWDFAGSGRFTFFSSSNSNLENWNQVGQSSNVIGEPIEIVFGTGTCSSYKYIYTSGHQILRAQNDWNFTDIGSQNPQLGLSGLPQLPSETTGRVASFALAHQTSQTRLLYGNYPSPNCIHTTTDFPGNDLCPTHPATCVQGSDPSSCPHAYVWHSDDCGNTWSTPTALGEPALHAQEVHAINVDPSNPMNIYVTVDVENADNNAGGLWRSTDGGINFTHVSTFPPSYPSLDISPIDFVFPTGSNQIFLESDGDSSVNVMPNGAAGGPLVSWDKVNGGPFQIAATWPSVPSGTPVWAGADLAIGVTSEQNIFLVSSAGGRNESQREGIWYFAPPYYNTPVLLGEYAPLINYVAGGNGVATAVTLAPHGLQPTDIITVTGVSVAAFNSSLDANNNPIPVQNFAITGPYTFNYSCPACPNYQEGTSGYATDVNLNLLGRTIEVTDPTTNFSYLYNGNTRFVKPEFTGAHQTLSNLNEGGGYFETYFIGSDQHVHMLLNNTNTGAWGNHDINSYAQAPTNILPAPGSALSSLSEGWPYFETFFIGTDQRVHMLLNNVSEGAWGNHDINSYADTPTNILPAPASALTSLNMGWPYYATFFIGTDQHVHMLLNNVSEGAWGNHDINSYATGPSSVAPVVGGALSSVYLTNGNSEIFFIGMDEHVHLLLTSQGSWWNYDLNSTATSPSNVLPAVWTQLSALDLGSGNSEVFFIGTDLHVHRLLNMNGAWENDDVNSLGQAPTNITAMLASPVQAFALPNGASATYFTGTDQHAHQLYYNGNGSWGNYDLDSLAQAPTNVPPAVRSPYTIIDLGSGNSEAFFIGTDDHVHMFLHNGGAWGNWDINANAQAPTNTLPAPP